MPATRRPAHRRSIVTAEPAPVEVAAHEDEAIAEETAQVEAAPAPLVVRKSANAWWCPVHDRAMPLTEPPTPCDIGHEVPSDFQP